MSDSISNTELTVKYLKFGRGSLGGILLRENIHIVFTFLGLPFTLPLDSLLICPNLQMRNQKFRAREIWKYHNSSKSRSESFLTKIP